MAGQAAGCTREEIKACIKDIECNTQMKSGSSKMMGKESMKTTNRK